MKEVADVIFIFKGLDKKSIIKIFLLDAFLSFIYYFVPFAFTLFLTLPFTLEKAILVIGIFLVSKLFRVGGNYLLRNLSDNYLYEYQNKQYKEFYKSLSNLPAEVISKYQTGYFHSIIEKICELVRKILQAEYLSIVISLIFLFYTLYKQGLILFIIGLFTSIICVFLSIKVLKKGNKQVEELYEQEYEYSSMYNDFISNIRTVKLLNNDNYFLKKIDKMGRKQFRENKKCVKYYAKEEMLRNFLIMVPFILGIVKAAIDLASGIDTIGVITFYIALQVEMGFVFEELSGTIINVYELKVITKKVKKIFNLNDFRKEIKDFNNIICQNIVIKYTNTDLKIKVKEFLINKNDRIMITGKSGQGKTSFVNLLLGNITSYEGQVLIDKEDLLDVKLDIGVVSQEIELFNMTIKENLCLDKQVNDLVIRGYLEELELEEIFTFKDGIYTNVDEKGLKLSTGQKRRINILRAFLMNKEIYILDEPTSNLDKHTEEVVCNFILKYFKDKTLIIVTHNEKLKIICNKFYEFKNHNLAKKPFKKDKNIY